MTGIVKKVLIKRILTSILLLFFLVNLIFVLIRLAPGDATQRFIFREPVVDVIAGPLLFTIIFAVICFALQILISFWAAIKTSQNINGKLDRFYSMFFLVIYSTPAFVIGVILIYFFSVQIDLFPSSGLRSIGFNQLSFTGKLIDYASHLVLPVITLSFAGTAIFYRYLRDSLEDVYHQTFVLNLRAAGVYEEQILKKHIIPNALRPLISIAGIELGILLSGALITEVIFGLPGFGRLTVEAIFARDYPLVIGCTFVSALMVLVANFAADIIKVSIDTRLVREVID